MEYLFFKVVNRINFQGNLKIQIYASFHNGMLFREVYPQNVWHLKLNLVFMEWTTEVTDILTP